MAGTSPTPTTDRPIAYQDDQGRICYRASAVGGCSRALLAARLGLNAVSPKDWLLEKFDESRGLEGEIVAQYMEGRRDEGNLPLLTHSPDDRPMEFLLTSYHGFPIIVTGHGDAFGDPGSRVIGEVKAMATSGWKKLVRDLQTTPALANHLSYAAQVLCYLEGYDAGDCAYMVRNKDTGELFVRGLTRDDLPLTLDDLRDKVRTIEARVRTGKLSDACDVPSFFCPFPYLHDELEVDELEGAQAMVLDGLCEAYEEQRGVERRAKELKGELGQKIAAYMREKGERGGDGKLRVGGVKFQVTLVENEGREVVSERLLREAGIDPGRFKERGKGFSYPLVKERGE